MGVLSSVINVEKSKHNFTKVVGNTPFEWFLNGCTPEQKRLFKECTSVEQLHITQDLLSRIRKLDEIHWSASKGSVFHFFACYPHDKKLKELVRIMNAARISVK